MAQKVTYITRLFSDSLDAHPPVLVALLQNCFCSYAAPATGSYRQYPPPATILEMSSAVLGGKKADACA
eukprot:3532874-Amphidinium_carterae.1